MPRQTWLHMANDRLPLLPRTFHSRHVFLSGFLCTGFSIHTGINNNNRDYASSILVWPVLSLQSCSTNHTAIASTKDRLGATGFAVPKQNNDGPSRANRRCNLDTCVLSQMVFMVKPAALPVFKQRKTGKPILQAQLIYNANPKVAPQLSSSTYNATIIQKGDPRERRILQAQRLYNFNPAVAPQLSSSAYLR